MYNSFHNHLKSVSRVQGVKVLGQREGSQAGPREQAGAGAGAGISFHLAGLFSLPVPFHQITPSATLRVQWGRRKMWQNLCRGENTAFAQFQQVTTPGQPETSRVRGVRAGGENLEVWGSMDAPLPTLHYFAESAKSPPERAAWGVS